MLFHATVTVESTNTSSTFLTISRIWNGRPLTFEKGTASISYSALLRKNLG